MIMPHIATRAFNTPLMIDAGKAADILAGIGGRIVDGGVSLEGVEPVHHVAFGNGRPSAGVLFNKAAAYHDAKRIAVFDVVDNVAVIPVEGTLVYKGAYIGESSGETSYQGLQVQIKRAMNNDAIRAVVFEVDSYGGEVSGVFETTEMIAALSAKKPTLAILTDYAYSAGYLLASAARQIVMPEFGGAGSIGALIVHLDLTKKLEKDGVTATLIRAGQNKTEGSPFEPLQDDMRGQYQAIVDAVRVRFTETVGRNRGMRLPAARAMQTEARGFNATQSLEMGLVDGIGDPNQMFEAFVKSVNQL
jgi:capsid assembly protease